MVENRAADWVAGGRLKTSGPFMVQAEDEGNATVRDAAGEPFCWVIAAECVGGDKAAAKARATRIAESLNQTEGHHAR